MRCMLNSRSTSLMHGKIAGRLTEEGVGIRKCCERKWTHSIQQFLEQNRRAEHNSWAKDQDEAEEREKKGEKKSK